MVPADADGGSLWSRQLLCCSSCCGAPEEQGNCGTKRTVAPAQSHPVRQPALVTVSTVNVCPLFSWVVYSGPWWVSVLWLWQVGGGWYQGDADHGRE